MTRVKPAVNRPSHSSPKSFTAAAPATAAPAVAAAVLKVRMAVMGFSTSRRSSSRIAPAFLPCLRNCSTRLKGKE